MAKKSNKRKGHKPKKTQPTASDVGPSSSRLSTPRIPTSINDLPDELLDDIALFVDYPSLKSLALVERRFYEPARRQSWWITKGFMSLLDFLDALLEHPRLAVLVRRLQIGRDLGLSSTRESRRNHNGDIERSLHARASKLVIEQCLRLEMLMLESIPGPKQSDDRNPLLAAIGRLQHLRGRGSYLAILDPMDCAGLALVLPTSREVEQLDVGAWAEEHEPIITLPECQVAQLTLHVISMSQAQLSALLLALGHFSQIITFSVTSSDLGLPHRLLEGNNLTTALKPYMSTERFSHFVINCPPLGLLGPDPARFIRAPKGVGLVFYLDTSPDEEELAIWWMGPAHTVLDRVARFFDSRTARGKIRSKMLWARRGRNWDISYVSDVIQVALGAGLSITWMDRG